MGKRAYRLEDYLQRILCLSKKKLVHAADLARDLGVSRPTVCMFLKQLQRDGYVTIGAHHIITLTPKGMDIAKIAQESGFSEGYIREAGEYTPGSALANLFSNRAYGPTNEDYLWNIQYNLITELAQKEACVIVGRCADYILRDTADCLKVFIHADMDFRSKRIVEVYGEQEASPEQRLKDKDKRRAAYHRFYTNMKWGQSQNYHITLDSGALGLERCTEIICSLY